jgi:hypothetical protein
VYCPLLGLQPFASREDLFRRGQLCDRKGHLTGTYKPSLLRRAASAHDHAASRNEPMRLRVSSFAEGPHSYIERYLLFVAQGGHRIHPRGSTGRHIRRYESNGRQQEGDGSERDRIGGSDSVQKALQDVTER